MQQANSINQQTAQLHRSELHDDHHDGMWQVVWCKDSWHDIANRVRARLPSWAELVVVDDSIPVCEQVANAHVIIPTTGIVDATVINNASHLRLITQPATAHHNIAVDVATARGIPVCTAPGVNAQSVAEQALMMMLMLARKVDAQRQSFAQGIIGQPPGHLLSGKTLGIVGMGNIGTRLARAAEGLGMYVQGVTSSCTPDAMDALFRTSDVVSLHCPVTHATSNLVNHRMLLEVIKPGAILLNLARADVLNKDALLQALNAGRLGGVGLDVHWHEPADPDDPLYANPKVLALPHAGVASVEVYDAYTELLVGNIVACREGKLLHGVLNGVQAARAL